MRGIRPPALFELRAHEWRNAVDSHHTPLSGSPLFSKQVRLARPVDIPKWPAEPKLDRAKAGPRGRTCTCNLSVLSGTPLHWATRGEKIVERRDSNVESLHVTVLVRPSS